MNRILVITATLLVFLTGCNITSDKMLIKGEQSLFKTSKVYRWGNAKEYYFIEPRKDNTYLMRGNIKGGKSISEYVLTVSQFKSAKAGSGKSKLYIIAAQIRDKDRKKGEELSQPMYFFWEKTSAGQFYIYRARWLITDKKYEKVFTGLEDKTVALKSKKELLKIAQRVFSQGRKKAAIKQSVNERDRSDPEYISLTSK